ncbi:hypothetical protein C8R48DRAFT_774537 [Suillus tomentosus]|nr:hypothetical protein C8R48DRAFT_774537 [Suillus tomentosus]
MLAWYRDPQPVQQDEPDHDPSIEIRFAVLVLFTTITYDFNSSVQENHFTDYDTSGDIPGITIDGPPSHLTSPTCGTKTISVPTDPPLPHPNDSDVLASLVDERVLTEDFFTHVKRNDLRHSLTFVLWTQTAGPDDEDTELSTEAVTTQIPTAVHTFT